MCRFCHGPNGEDKDSDYHPTGRCPRQTTHIRPQLRVVPKPIPKPILIPSVYSCTPIVPTTSQSDKNQTSLTNSTSSTRWMTLYTVIVAIAFTFTVIALTLGSY